MGNNQYIQITVKNGEKTVKVNMPPRSNLLEKSLKVLYNSGENDVIERDYVDDDYNYPHRMSKELKRNKKFTEFFDTAIDEFDDFYYQQYKFSNILEISTDKNKISINQTFNKEKWRELLSSMFDKIIGKNVESLIVHVSSKIPEDEKSKLVDDLTKPFLNIPAKIFKSDRKNKSTLVELFFFGRDIERYQYDDF